VNESIDHHSELQMITTLSFISTIQKSPQYPLSLFSSLLCLSSAVPYQRLLKLKNLQLPALRSYLHSLSCRAQFSADWQLNGSPQLSSRYKRKLMRNAVRNEFSNFCHKNFNNMLEYLIRALECGVRVALTHPSVLPAEQSVKVLLHQHACLQG
jgi:hypothetical protein